MSRAGDVHENPVTGEYVVVRVGSEESGGRLAIADLYVSPGGAVAGEHVHPAIEEVFTVVAGSVGFRVDGREDVAGPGRRLVVPPGVAHYWWNAGDEEAHVVVELRGEARLLDGFVTMLSNLFGMAREGKTDAKGRPNLLRAALLAREFDDVIRFVQPPRALQKVLFGVLAPVARLLGYRAVYPGYGPSGFVEVEPWPGYGRSGSSRQPQTG
ncbi:cupin domain-containing protein [Rubrobacter tropicus]|uniref:Cupin domain-containing protein n=1 Tax=Rubrobacter tropicus TaxID=2653851 RepID=A0A6G8Q7B2_9ACTN|nr:cupin domain-containing protein [Rubrobacter tropicus]QIN82329.1 cupin domain-containing protein [Rubrobacter tropicus]